jgi:SAM-dependent methyltransferase
VTPLLAARGHAVTVHGSGQVCFSRVEPTRRAHPERVSRCVADLWSLPFADASFDVVVCHLAFMLFDDIESVVRELTRVVRPGGKFVAVLGGGPTADGHDAFHAFARLLPPGISFGDRRASSETGWRQLFGDRWRGPIEFERHLIDMSGTFDEVWRFLAASYQAPRRDVGDELRAQFPGERVPLAVVTYLATITR